MGTKQPKYAQVLEKEQKEYERQLREAKTTVSHRILAPPKPQPIAPVTIPMGEGCHDVYDTEHSVQTIFGPGYECTKKREDNFKPAPPMRRVLLKERYLGDTKA